MRPRAQRGDNIRAKRICPRCRNQRPKPGARVCSECRGRAYQALPLATIQQRYRLFLATYRAWRAKGTLPGPGGLLDQPATWCAATRLIDDELDRIAEDQDIERRMKARK